MALPARAEVAIVGGGPVGLALAATLARAGVDVCVLEKLAARDPRARASHVHGGVLDGLAATGLSEAELASGKPSYGAKVWFDDTLASEVDTRSLPFRRPYTLALPQPDLEGLLEAHATRAGARLVRDAEVTAVDESGVVTARVGGVEERVSAGFVVGCDGPQSVVREAIGTKLWGWTQQGLALADVDVPSDLEHAHLHCGAYGVAFRIPLQRGERWVTSIDAGQDESHVVALMRDRLPLSAPAEVTFASLFRLHARWATRWRRGRAFLAGDAAHLHSPVGGHGMNTGLLDALDLGWKLVQVLRHGAPDALLDSYERTRRPQARRSVLQAWAATVAFRMQNPLLRFVRRTFAPFTPGFVDRHIAWWSVAQDIGVPGRDRARGGWCRAGGRAADPEVDGGYLLDGARALPTVLSRVAIDVPPWAVRAPLPPTEAVRTAYGDAEALLVRPDGFLAYRGPAEGVPQALSALRGGEA
ncbi:MAG: FAD-dependent monooxygenase [Alphaproteobacteria bacterium]|nr:FAD-dependent monooxygenase [Alphaproteobacteria bacterium]